MAFTGSVETIYCYYFHNIFSLSTLGSDGIKSYFTSHLSDMCIFVAIISEGSRGDERECLTFQCSVMYGAAFL